MQVVYIWALYKNHTVLKLDLTLRGAGRLWRYFHSSDPREPRLILWAGYPDYKSGSVTGEAKKRTQKFCRPGQYLAILRKLFWQTVQRLEFLHFLLNIFLKYSRHTQIKTTVFFKLLDTCFLLKNAQYNKFIATPNLTLHKVRKAYCPMQNHKP